MQNTQDVEVNMKDYLDIVLDEVDAKECQTVMWNYSKNLICKHCWKISILLQMGILTLKTKLTIEIPLQKGGGWS